MCQPHAAQHVWRLAELDVLVADNLDAIAPGIAEVEERPRQRLDARFDQRLMDCIFVVDHEPEVATVVWRLAMSPLKREELVAKVNKRHILAFPAKLEFEYSSVKRQRFLDIATSSAT